MGEKIMILLSTIINRFEDRFLKTYSYILPQHKKALQAMKICRQEHGPQMLAICTGHDCGKRRYIPHSCGHRNCPHCQNHESWQWTEKQLTKLLPAYYFLLTFTLPAELRDLAWRNQKIVYSLMFDCVQDVLKTFTRNDKNLQGNAGFTAVLHTNSRSLGCHPHIHVVMPGASINPKTGMWRKKSTNYLFNNQALARVFRAKLLESLVTKGLRVPKKCPKKWIVDCKDVGRGDKAIIYLGRYLYKGVIQEKDIVSCDDETVTYRYVESGSKELQTKTVSGARFLYLLLLHVLPKGFRRTRCYGFLHPCSKKMIKLLQLVLRLNPLSLITKVKQRPKITCPACGRVMVIVQTRIWLRSKLKPHLST
jgi:hypothetical protein